MKSIITTSILASVIGSIGSLGVYLNFANPDWRVFGVNPVQMVETINSFPQKHCPEISRPMCKKIAVGVKGFLGL